MTKKISTRTLVQQRLANLDKIERKAASQSKKSPIKETAFLAAFMEAVK